MLVATVAIALVLEPTLWRGLLRVSPPSVTVTQALQAEPTPHRLREIATFSLQDIPMPRGPAAIGMADRLLAGGDFMQGFSGFAYALPFTVKAAASDHMLQRAGVTAGLTPVRYQMPFSEDDLLRSDGIGPLPYASLYLADVLLAAYSASGDDRYLAAARDAILEFSRYERTLWRSLSFVWNDHALSARAGVLVRFWQAWRDHRLYRPDEAQELMTQVARTVELLASPRDFNVRTNHGVMQNLGLLQLLMAFPMLEHAKEHWATGVQRLSAQIPFLYAHDGFVLEHSAHYHDVGVQLLTMAVRLLELAGEPVPALWRQRLEAARQRLTDLTRPDGTLPAYGDTELELSPAGGPAPETAAPALTTRFAAYPLSGYAVWSFGAPQPSHTVAVWSAFPGHGHKLADELSVLLWGSGRGWISNSGYWDYSGWGRRFTEGWTGSNAPHGLGDRSDEMRVARLAAAAHDDESAYADLRRDHADGARYRREVVNLSRSLWLVVDTTEGVKAAQVETLWTFMPDLSLQPRSPEDFVVRDDAGAQMAVAVRADRPIRTEFPRASREPFAGWVTMGREGLPATALRVLSDSGARTAALFSMDATAAAGFTFEATADGGWRASGTGWRAERNADAVRWQRGDLEQRLLPEAPADVQAARQQLRTSYEQALKSHPREPKLDRYRDRIALLLLGGFLLQETTLATLRRFVPVLRSRRIDWTVSLGLAVLWLAMWWWLQAMYFHVR